MFGKRGGNQGSGGFGKACATAPAVTQDAPKSAAPVVASQPVTVEAPVLERMEKAVAKTAVQPMVKEKTEEYYDTKSSVFTALIDTIDLGQLSRRRLSSRAKRCFQ